MRQFVFYVVFVFVYSALTTRRVGIKQDVTVIGGVALNKGFIDSLERFLKSKVTVPEDPIFTSVVGAALIAQGKGE